MDRKLVFRLSKRLENAENILFRTKKTPPPNLSSNQFSKRLALASFVGTRPSPLVIFGCRSRFSVSSLTLFTTKLSHNVEKYSHIIRTRCPVDNLIQQLIRSGRELIRFLSWEGIWISECSVETKKRLQGSYLTN